MFKVLSGSIKTDDHLMNTTSGTDERLHGLFRLRGKEQTPVTTVVAGDIAAVAKLAHTRTGDTLAPKGTPVRVPGPALLPPVFAIAVRPRTQSDDDKLGGALQRLQAEDPALIVDRVEETRQTLVRGLGDTHVAVALERLARKFGVNVEIEDVRVPYRETVAGSAEAEGKVKKQSGGHGQYAVAHLRVAPRDRGSGFEFVDKIVGGAIPRQFIPAVQKGVEETMAQGGVHGFPVVDLRVECYDGKYHSVDSSEMAFKTAASQGLKEAMANAGVRRARARVGGDRHGAVGVPGRRDGRHQLPPWARARHERRRQRRTGDHGARAELRAHPLRDRPPVDDRRPGTLQRRARPLRRAAGASGRQGQGDAVGLARMSGSSPSDLAVAFRSLDRRLREALAPVTAI